MWEKAETEGKENTVSTGVGIREFCNCLAKTGAFRKSEIDSSFLGGINLFDFPRPAPISHWFWRARLSARSAPTYLTPRPRWISVPPGFQSFQLKIQSESNSTFGRQFWMAIRGRFHFAFHPSAGRCIAFSIFGCRWKRAIVDRNSLRGGKNIGVHARCTTINLPGSNANRRYSTIDKVAISFLVSRLWYSSLVEPHSISLYFSDALTAVSSVIDDGERASIFHLKWHMTVPSLALQRVSLCYFNLRWLWRR